MLNKMKKLFGTKEEKKSEYELIQVSNYTKIEAEHNGVITAGGPLLKLYS